MFSRPFTFRTIRRNLSSQYYYKSKNSNKQQLPPYICVTAASTVLAGGYCYYSFLDTVPLTQRSRWIATSPIWENEMGDAEYLNLLQHFQRDILPPNHRASITVHRVGARIAKAAQEFSREYNLQDNSQPFTYTIVRSDTANAFVLPGNHVFVMTGLFKYVRNEDDLAAVLGHEVAHTLARHAGERISSSAIMSLLSRLALLLDPSGILFAILMPTSTILRDLPHSRTQESEADQIGLDLAARACFDPRAAKRVFQAMQNDTGHGKGNPPEFLSTHPSHQSRISRLDTWEPGAMQVYRRDHCRVIRQQMELARQLAMERHP
ncbi:hypothetical protein FisN_1Hh171 [Fistulifera solaris]|jgi:predicted Zn-dependent protease|uniref:Peptidase M48 domain-containing protein n=1 Tax=Fistulifera solaris TaxID=1519565 RepID=A0A1Z5JEQ3_FISSO|nr:hypothetical protein FisN_1Hh171 [Fistulifera solaris]|eukprot:GAX12241.1 hypothetical protein FisN_1Hh171 [Fistulifera solaris]